MDNIFSGLKMIAATCLFCLGIASLLRVNRLANQDLNHLQSTLIKKSDAVIYEAYENSEDITNSSEIIAALMTKPDYDIKIDELEIKAEEYEVEGFDLSVIKKGNYHKKYMIDAEENVEKVIYERIGD